MCAFAREVGWPLIAKPRLGFASRGVRLLFTESQLKAAAALPELVFQEYLGDPQPAVSFLSAVESGRLPIFYSLETEKHSVQLYIRGDGSTAGPFCTRHRMREGKSISVEAVDSAELTVLAARYASTFRDAGWRGPLNIQCQRRPGGPLKAYELNGRMTGATAARLFLGFDELGLAMQDLLNMRPPEAAPSSSTVPLKFQRTTAVASADIKNLEDAGVWER